MNAEVRVLFVKKNVWSLASLDAGKVFVGMGTLSRRSVSQGSLEEQAW